MLHTLRFSLQNAVYFIMLPFFPVLYTFYIQVVLKFKCKTPVPKGLKSTLLIERAWRYVFPFCIRNNSRTFECPMEDVLKPVYVIASCRFNLQFMRRDNTSDTCMCLLCRCLRLYVLYTQSADQQYVMRKSGLFFRSHIST
jgi:hypothetical protein